MPRERIIVPLDRQFVVYHGGAGIDEGAGVDEGARVDEREECSGVVYPGSCAVLTPSSTPALLHRPG